MPATAIRAEMRHARPWPEWLVAGAFVLGFGTVLIAAALIDSAGVPIFVPVYVAAILALPFVLWRLLDRPAVIVLILATWFACHSLVTALLAPSLVPTSTAWLENFKEPMYLILFGILVVAFARNRAAWSLTRVRESMIAADWLALAMCVIVAVYFLVAIIFDPSNLPGQVVYARRFASLPVMYMIGRLLLPDSAQFNRAIRYLVIVALAVAIFGLIERLLLTDRFWTDFVHVEIYRQHIVAEGFGSPRARVPDGMPANWTSTLEGLDLRRLVSSFLEPTTLALFLALATIVATTERLVDGGPRWRWLGVAVLVAALVLTLGKGGALVVVVWAATMVFRVVQSNARRWLLAACVIIVALYVVAQLLPVATNINNHLSGLLTGLGQLLTQPLGTGLGSTGYWGEIRRIGNDSTVGAIAAQTGYAGAIVYVAWLTTATLRLLPAQQPTDRLQMFGRALAGALLGLLAVAFVSNSASGLTGSAFFLVFGGWLISINEERETSTR